MKKTKVYNDKTERCGWSKGQNKLFVNLEKDRPDYYKKAARLKNLPNAVRKPRSYKFYIPVESYAEVIALCKHYNIQMQPSIIEPIKEYKYSLVN